MTMPSRPIVTWIGHLVCAFAVLGPVEARPTDSVPLPPALLASDPMDAPRLWVGARLHRDWETFEISLSDGTRWERPPQNRLGVEAGMRLGRHASASLDLTGVGLGASLQLDVRESERAKLAVLVHGVLGRGFGGAAGIAGSFRASLGNVRVLPFLRVDFQTTRVSIDRGRGDVGPAYNWVSRREEAAVPMGGVALGAGAFELQVGGGWRAIVHAGTFDEQRVAEPERRGGAIAFASVRWVLATRREGS